jgi:hypothetical protein
MRRLVVASAILATLLIMPLALAAPASATAPTDHERATAALRYLWSAQLPDGSIDHSIGETADFVIGTAAAGYDPATLLDCSMATTALEYLVTASDTATGDAAKTGKTILAVVAAGADPANFGGRDLLARLSGLYHANGNYGDGSTFAQAFAILALHASGRSVHAAALMALLALQDTDGSWSYGTAPVAAGGGDTNSTAIALMALASVGDHSADPSALAYLKTQQLADGGFPYQNSSIFGPPASDPDSDSMVLQALVAAGENPESAAWAQGSNTLLTHLRSTQGTDGGFAYPGSGESAFTTSQVTAALVRVPYADAVHWTSGRSMLRECISTGATASPEATPTPTVSPTPIPTPTPTPTAKPTVRPTVRATVRPSAAPTEPTAVPVVAVTVSPTVEPTAAPTLDLAAAQASGPDEQVAGVTFAPGITNPGPSAPNGPSPLLYGVAAAFALFTALAGGWLYINRPWVK